MKYEVRGKRIDLIKKEVQETTLGIVKASDPYKAISDMLSIIAKTAYPKADILYMGMTAIIRTDNKSVCQYICLTAAAV